MIPRVCWMPAQGGLVNTRSSQRRLLHQLSMMCTFSVGIVAMAQLGLDHYEGRGWRGFHHHATLCIAAYGFLVRERSLFPPDEHFRRPAPALPRAGGPEGIPVRPERHNPSSITSVRRRLTVALVRCLPRCPCCQQQHFRGAASLSPVRNL